MNVPSLTDLRVGDLSSDIVAEGIAASVPIVELKPAAIRLDQIRRVISKVITHLEARITVEVPVGDYVDPDTGDRWAFLGAASWEVKDPDGLRAALVAAQVDPALIERSFRVKTEVLHTDLNRLATADGELSGLINDFRTRKYGPKHMTNMSEKEKVKR